MEEFLCRMSGVERVSVESVCDVAGVDPASGVVEDLNVLSCKELEIMLIYYVVKYRLFDEVKDLSTKEKMFIRCVQQDITSIHTILELRLDWLELWEEI